MKVNNLTRKYSYSENTGGFLGTIKSLFHTEKLEKTALDEFSFNVEEGEFIGLIGPNGAGKTTLIKLLTGIIKPTSGSASVLGYNPAILKDEFKRQYALVMAQKSQLWWDLPAKDSFLLNKEIYGISQEKFDKNLEYFTELFQVKDLLNVQARRLSLGERMKMELISCLLHEPKVLFLDEPTIGLDAIAQKQMREFLKRINKEKGVTIFLTSHYIEDIKYLCDRVMVINKGRKMYDGNLDSLLNKYSEYKTVSVIFEEKTDVKLDGDIEWVERSPYKIVIKIDKKEVNRILSKLLNDYKIKDINIEEEDITNLIEKIYLESKVIDSEKVL